MSKKFTKKIGRFDEKTYNSNRQAVLALTEAGMSIVKISEALKLGASTIHAMRKYGWTEYQAYRDEKYAKRQEVIAKGKDAFSNIEAVTYEFMKEPTQDQTFKVLERLESIEQKIDKILTTKRFF
jgi:IS30 family transposase